jgi:hypothetical protein
MKHVLALLLFFAAIGMTPTDALAYIGPGAGISAVGALLALVAAIGLAIVGFVWYPIKRIRGRLQKTAAQSANAAKSKSPGE